MSDFTSVLPLPLARLTRLRPWMVLAALLAVCLAKGLWFAHGLAVPTDADIVRDIGFIQGLRDGNWFGDPAQAGAWRWYPPLLHALAAGVAGLSGWSVMDGWLAAGPWLNLASPLAFFVMSRRLIGDWPACAASAVFVLFNSATMAGDEAAGYTPWTYTPGLAWPLFFAAVWLIHAKAGSPRWRDALLLGTVIGLVFLAHTVPALLLCALTPAAVLAARGMSLRSLAWLALVAGGVMVWALPFLLPLVLAYRLHIANPVPGAWQHPLLTPAEVIRMLSLNLPGGLAALLLLCSGCGVLPRVTAAILAAWVAVCLLFLARHYACGLTGGGTVCGVFVIPAHHFHVYLQAAWACLVGCAVAAALRAMSLRDRRALACGPMALAVVTGAALLFVHPADRLMRGGTATEPETVLDRAAYDWLLRHTAPDDLFVTELPAELDQMGPAAATVLAAGRRLVAPPRIHANPYLDWPRLEARRTAYLHAALAGEPGCAFVREAGRGRALLLLPRSQVLPAATPLLRTASHTVFRVVAPACGEGP